jgi:hypothetical protein
MSLALDIRIILYTIIVMLEGRGKWCADVAMCRFAYGFSLLAH